MLSQINYCPFTYLIISKNIKRRYYFLVMPRLNKQRAFFEILK